MLSRPTVLRAALALTLVACVPAAMAAPEYPPRKAGLWELRTTGAGMPETVMSQCVDRATDEKMQALGQGMAAGMCGKMDVSKEGGAYVVEAECQMGSARMRSRAVTTGDYASEYRTRSTVTFNPPLPGQPPSMESTVHAKWLGACKAGQKPGDMIMPDGSKMNLLEGGGMGMPRR